MLTKKELKEITENFDNYSQEEQLSSLLRLELETLLMLKGQ